MLPNRLNPKSLLPILWLILFLVLAADIRFSQVPSPEKPPEDTTLIEQSKAQELNELKNELKEIKQKLNKSPKDNWDKWATISPALSGFLTFISAIIVALIGVYVTQKYTARQKDRELKYVEIQTIEKFFPYLSGTEKQKEAAIQAIASLGNEELATRIARTFGGSGASAALARIASLPNSKITKSAEVALSELFYAIRPSVVLIESTGTRVGIGFFVSSVGLVLTTAHLASKLDSGKSQIKLASGQYLPIKVEKIDKSRGLGLLRAETDEPVIPLLMIPATADIGESVIALGQSASDEWLATVGTVVDIHMRAKISDVLMKVLGIRMSKIPGFVGSPVVNTKGSFIGILEAYTELDWAFIVSEDRIRAFLEQELAI